jgi:hypothetical protein
MWEPRNEAARGRVVFVTPGKDMPDPLPRRSDGGLIAYGVAEDQDFTVRVPVPA